MTTEQSDSETTQQFDPLLSDKCRSVVSMFVTGGVLLLLFRNPLIPAAIRLVFAIALVLGLVRWSAAILLVLIQVDLTLQEDSLPVPLGLFLDVATSVLTVVLLMSVCRLCSAQEMTVRQPVWRMLKLIFEGRTSSAEPSTVRPDFVHEHPAGLTSFTWLSVFVLTAAAELLLVLFPADRSSVSGFGLTPPGMRCIQIGLVLVILYSVVTIPLGELWWRRISPDQAGMYLRSLFLGWSHRDLRMVVRGGIRRRRKAVRRLRAKKSARPGYRSFRLPKKDH